MASTRVFRPNWVSAPGDTISDILEARGLSETAFAKRIGQSDEQTRHILNGRAAITIAIARRLAAVLGASVEFWMSRDYQYREDIRKLEIHADWLSQLPIGDMIKFGWLTSVPHPSEEAAACLRFFDVKSVPEWRRKYNDWNERASFRTSPSFNSRPASVISWLRKGEIEASKINCSTWSAKQFGHTLVEIRSLTRQKNPNKFLPQLLRICAKSGVAVAIVRVPNGCHASGAAFFVSSNKALIMLSFRYLTDDHFWFTFFHESAHLLLHRERGLFLESSDQPSTREEKEANEFAANILVPIRHKKRLLELGANSRQIIKFARVLRISPGIVVGQMQHHGLIGFSQMNSLKRHFSWKV